MPKIKIWKQALLPKAWITRVLTALSFKFLFSAPRSKLSHFWDFERITPSIGINFTRSIYMCRGPWITNHHFGLTTVIPTKTDPRIGENKPHYRVRFGPNFSCSSTSIKAIEKMNDDYHIDNKNIICSVKPWTRRFQLKVLFISFFRLRFH